MLLHSIHTNVIANLAIQPSWFNDNMCVVEEGTTRFGQDPKGGRINRMS